MNQETFISATIAEMIHSATLIHDDVVDDDDIRRGQSSVKARWGNSTAVLAGDYLLAKAMLMLIQLGDFDIMQEMLYTAAAMSEGELFQNAATEESKVVSQEAYLDIITRKTAMLMRTCCSMGALSVKAPTEQVEKIASFGLNFGILFQLRDDILDNENAEIAQALLPTYLEKAMQDLDGFEPSNIVDALHNLTVFCAEREG